MKSLATMLAMAKAKAESFGVRVWKGVRCGFFLTIGELLGLYRSEGFNGKGTAMRHHLVAWMGLDEAVVEGSDEDLTSAVWFPCPEGKETLVMVRSQECGGHFVTKIDRTEWPVLRQMHGIQEVLA